MHPITHPVIQFNLPEHLACPKPTEERKLSRDDVRLLVTTDQGQTSHTLFKNLDQYLQAGDVLVVNTSATVPSALPVKLPDGRNGMLHLSTRLNAREWFIEIREIQANKTLRWKAGEEGMVFQLPGGASVQLQKRFYQDQQLLDLWIAAVNIQQPTQSYLANYARPIKYDRLQENYPLAYYQTFFSFHPGSAEMPSAGRGFTPALVEKLLKKGVTFAPVLLHTGISSLEENEAPYPEYMEVSPLTAAMLNTAKSQGRRIIAVGTTTIRAIESAANEERKVLPYQGNTSLYIDESYQMKVADGLLSGFHEPRASHLHILQSMAGYAHIAQAYEAAIQANYYWHQFGDLHLMLP